MVCSRCGETGHNKSSINCPRNILINNLPNLYSFTQGYVYYMSSLNYITKIYPEILCISGFEIRWTGNFNILKTDIEKALKISKNCPYPFIFYNLRVTYQGISHANSIIINTKDGRFTRYEPHGSNESWGDLDLNLIEISILNNVKYDPPLKNCLYFGIQTMMGDSIGFCQTAVLYNLLSRIDVNKYNYINTVISPKRSRDAIFSLMVDLLLNIYQKLPKNLKTVFLGYNNLNVFQKNTLNETIITTQTQN